MESGNYTDSWDHLYFMDDSNRTLITFDLFRGLVILFMRKLKVRLTLYFSDSALAGMMYLSHSSSGILQNRICYRGLQALKRESNTFMYVCTHKCIF